MNIDKLGRIALDEIKYVEDDRGRLLQPGDVLFNNTNSPALIGKTAYFDRLGDFAFSNHMTRLRTPEGVDPKYLAVRLHTLWLEGVFQQLCSHHVNQASVSSARLLAEVTVALPPLNEQRRIVGAIEEQFSRLDAAEESTRQAGRRMEGLRATVLTGSFAGEWPTKPLASVTDPERPIRYGILMPKEHIEHGVLYVRVMDYPDGRINLAGLKRTSPEIAAKYRRATLKAGDVLLAIRGTYGRVAIVPPELEGGNITQDTARIAPLEHLDARFVAAYLKSPLAQRYFQRVARGVAVKGVNIGDLRTMPLPVPPIEEQLRIVTEVEDRLSLIDGISNAIEVTKRRSATLRRSILERAFRGELVPQDPTDEPATALLERIRAERDAAPPPRRRRVRA
jgi:type I restriction enzyme S subunit